MEPTSQSTARALPVAVSITVALTFVVGYGAPRIVPGIEMSEVPSGE